MAAPSCSLAPTAPVESALSLSVVIDSNTHQQVLQCANELFTPSYSLTVVSATRELKH